MLFTVGHSTRPIHDFISLVKSNRIERLVDIRTVPRSRHNPQFDSDSLANSLRDAGIAYEHVRSLGGLRHPRKDSPNTGWRNEGFRGYADYMQTREFDEALAALLEKTKGARVAIMCAEAVPWRCHRSLVSDAAVARGVPVEHIISTGRTQPHTLTRFAKVEGTRITYPPEQPELELRNDRDKTSV